MPQPDLIVATSPSGYANDTQAQPGAGSDVALLGRSCAALDVPVVWEGRFARSVRSR